MYLGQFTEEASRKPSIEIVPAYYVCCNEPEHGYNLSNGSRWYADLEEARSAAKELAEAHKDRSAVSTIFVKYCWPWSRYNVFHGTVERIA